MDPNENGKAVVKKRKVGKPTKPNLDKIKERIALLVDKRVERRQVQGSRLGRVWNRDKIITSEVENKIPTVSASPWS